MKNPYVQLKRVSTLKELNGKIDKYIKHFNKNFNSLLNISSSESSEYKNFLKIHHLMLSDKYTDSFIIKGLFRITYNEIVRYIGRLKKTTKICICCHRITVNKVIKFKLSNVYQYKNKCYITPYSYIVFNNDDYNLLTNNCMQKSVDFLSYGSIRYYNKEFHYKLDLIRKLIIPNSAFSNIKSFFKNRRYF